jgi:hypothetical protein
MDYRHRNYYLAKIDYFSYDMRIEYFKWAAPSLKIHPPYYHIRSNHRPQDCINGRYWQMMLSCKKEDSETLEYELRKAERRDEGASRFLKLNKEICGQ